MGKSKEATRVSSDKDPCWRERKKSMDCLSENSYDRACCQAEFENYKQCKGFWVDVRWSRKKAGLYPLVPESEEERRAFKMKYAETGEVPTEV